MSTLKNIDSFCEQPNVIDARTAAESHSTVSRDDRNMHDVISYLGDLFSRLTNDLSQLFSLHMDLLKAEMLDSARTLARDSAMLVVAMVLGWFAFAGITLALASVIAGALPIANPLMAFAAGAAIVGVAYAIIAAILAMAGIKNLREKSLTPDRTIHEVKRDKDAVKEIHP